MGDKVRVGVIGAGRIGQIHTENLMYRVPDADVIAIADINQAAAEACAVRLNIPEVTADPQAIFERSDIDAVLICSPTPTHAPQIEAAAAAGKHIFCEKPIALDLDIIDGALAAVEKAGVRLQIGFNRRFDPNFRQVREMIEAGKVGDLHILRFTSRDPAPPPPEYIKASGGLFLDMTIHDFDMARYLTGSEVIEVYAAGGVRIDPAIGAAGDIDTAVVTLRFANDAIGAIDNSRKAVYGYDQRVEVFGSGGAVAVANNTPHNAVYSDVDGVHAAKPLYFFMQRYTQSFVNEMEAFIAAMRDGAPVPVTGADGRAAVVIGLAAWKSYRENRPVKLSEIG
ncbi:MAG: inositol 2-dehydrogenase [Anaerolineae bacterium]|nr:inositol 2-dehydrogenase [Anaerolineae bacterium]